jgi:hypothetical protein
VYRLRADEALDLLSGSRGTASIHKLVSTETRSTRKKEAAYITKECHLLAFVVQCANVVRQRIFQSTHTHNSTLSICWVTTIKSAPHQVILYGKAPRAATHTRHFKNSLVVDVSWRNDQVPSIKIFPENIAFIFLEAISREWTHNGMDGFKTALNARMQLDASMCREAQRRDSLARSLLKSLPVKKGSRWKANNFQVASKLVLFLLCDILFDFTRQILCAQFVKRSFPEGWFANKNSQW